VIPDHGGHFKVVKTYFDITNICVGEVDSAMQHDESGGTIRWGLVGCGNVAHRFVRALRHIEHAELCGVWSRRPEAAKEFVAEHGGVAFFSLAELLEADVDAIYIATLPDSHAEYSIKALQAKKAVLCEKPSAESREKLETILRVATDSGMLWMEAMKPPFYPLFTELKKHLQTDSIGTVQFVRCGSSLANVPPQHPSFNKHNGGGALLGIGVYGAWLATEFLGPAVNVQASGRYGSTGVDVFVSFQSTHANNSSSQLYCGLDLHGPGKSASFGLRSEAWIILISYAPHYSCCRRGASMRDSGKCDHRCAFLVPSLLSFLPFLSFFIVPFLLFRSFLTFLSPFPFFPFFLSFLPFISFPVFRPFLPFLPSKGILPRPRCDTQTVDQLS
jgi:hypothetical protein